LTEQVRRGKVPERAEASGNAKTPKISPARRVILMKIAGGEDAGLVSSGLDVLQAVDQAGDLVADEGNSPKMKCRKSPRGELRCFFLILIQ